MKFIHGADLHLDRAFEGLRDLPTELSSKLRQKNQEMLQEIVELAIIEKVDFVLLVGDTFHQATVAISTQKIVMEAFKKLAKNGISVVMTFGNHDYYNSETYWFEFPENVFLFKSEAVETIQLVTKNQEQVAISAFSYEHRWLESSKLGEYPQKNQQADYHIGLYHGTLGSENVTQNYAPFSLSEMTNKGYDYWALGHIHQPQVLKNNPPIIYSGSPVGHSKKETNSQGVVLVENQGNQLTYQWLNLGALEWQDVTLACQELTSRKELLLKIEELLLAFGERAESELSLVALELKTVPASLNSQISSELANGGLLNYLQERVFEESLGKLWLRSLTVLAPPETALLPLGVTTEMLSEISQKISRERFVKVTEELTRQGAIAYLLPKDDLAFQEERINSSLTHVLSELSQTGGEES